MATCLHLHYHRLLVLGGGMLAGSHLQRPLWAVPAVLLLPLRFLLKLRASTLRRHSGAQREIKGFSHLPTRLLVAVSRKHTLFSSYPPMLDPQQSIFCSTQIGSSSSCYKLCIWNVRGLWEYESLSGTTAGGPPAGTSPRILRLHPLPSRENHDFRKPYEGGGLP